jgi:hypothetical protein
MATAVSLLPEKERSIADRRGSIAEHLYSYHLILRDLWEYRAIDPSAI